MFSKNFANFQKYQLCSRSFSPVSINFRPFSSRMLRIGPNLAARFEISQNIDENRFKKLTQSTGKCGKWKKQHRKNTWKNDINFWKTLHFGAGWDPPSLCSLIWKMKEATYTVHFEPGYGGGPSGGFFEHVLQAFNSFFYTFTSHA